MKATLDDLAVVGVSRIISEAAGCSFARLSGVICRCRTWHQGDTIKLPWIHVCVCVLPCRGWCSPPPQTSKHEGNFVGRALLCRLPYPVFTPQITHGQRCRFRTRNDVGLAFSPSSPTIRLDQAQFHVRKCPHLVALSTLPGQPRT